VIAMFNSMAKCFHSLSLTLFLKFDSKISGFCWNLREKYLLYTFFFLESSLSLSSQCIGARYLLDVESWIWNDSEKREEKVFHIIVHIFFGWFEKTSLSESVRNLCARRLGSRSHNWWSQCSNRWLR
jgi:hypothetical protein